MKKQFLCMNKSGLLSTLVGIAITCSGIQASAEPPQASEVAKKLANPDTSLGFLAFQHDYIDFNSDLPDVDNQEAWRFNFQPSIPQPIAKGANFFLRPNIPVILDQPVFVDGDFISKGVDLGDIGFDMATGRGFTSCWQVIGGLAGTLETATDNELGGGQTVWSLSFSLAKGPNGGSSASW